MRRRHVSESALGLLGVLPALLLIGGLILYPVGYAVWLSLLDKHSFFPAERFVGLRDFRQSVRPALRAGPARGIGAAAQEGVVS